MNIVQSENYSMKCIEKGPWILNGLTIRKPVKRF